MGKKHNLSELNQSGLGEIFGIDIKDNELSIDSIIKMEYLIKIGLGQAIIYNYDSVISGNIEDINIDLNNIIECRFFNEDIEIRIFNDEDGSRGTIFIEEDADDYISEEYILYNRYGDKNYANALKVKKYMDYDEDKQAYIYYTKPCKLYFRGENR